MKYGNLLDKEINNFSIIYLFICVISHESSSAVGIFILNLKLNTIKGTYLMIL